MSKQLTGAVEALRSSTSRLNAVMDKAAATVQELEELMNDCGVGVPAWVTVTSRTDAGVTFNMGLAYERMGSRFRIGVYRDNDIDPEDYQVRSWAECSQHEKLQTLPKLAALIAEISKQVESKIAEAEEASDSVRELLASLRRGEEG